MIWHVVKSAVDKVWRGGLTISLRDRKVVDGKQYRYTFCRSSGGRIKKNDDWITTALGADDMASGSMLYVSSRVNGESLCSMLWG